MAIRAKGWRVHVWTLAALIAVSASATAMAEGEGEVHHHKDRENHVIAGFGLEMAYPFGGGSGDLLHTGSGANVHVGYEVDQGAIGVGVEVIGSYLYFPSAFRGVQEEDVDLKRLMLGVTTGYDLPLFDEQALIFSVYGRIGAGFLNASTVGKGGQSDTGFAFEAGVAITYQIVEQLGVGIQGGYGQVQAQYRDQDNVHWGLTELHFSVGF
jgi:hypothetical protein